MRNSYWMPAAAFVCLAACATPGSARQDQSLSDYAGVYAYHDGGRIDVIVDGERLAAVLAEAKYPLTVTGPDAFTNAVGGPIRFERNAAGVVIAVFEGAVRFERLASTVDEDSRGLGDPVAGRRSLDYVPPLERADGLRVGSVEGTPLGLATPQRIIDGVSDRTWPDVHSMLLSLDGRLVVEEYFYGHHADRPHQMRSATKSVIAATAGAAVAQGRLSGVEQRLGDLLDLDALGIEDATKQDITLGDLLTMRHGLDCDEDDERTPGHENRMYGTPDWVAFVLRVPLVRPPGGEGRYCSGAALTTGRLVERAVGVSLPEFAQASLFEPLGISRDAWSWNFTLDRSNPDFAQLRMRPRDMMKFGMMYAQGGVWQDRQVLAADWVAASLSPQSQVEGSDYGYLWWGQRFDVVMPDGLRPVQTYVASGNGGQKIWIVPEFKLVAVFTGGAYNRGNSPPNAIMAQVILPALINASR